MEWTISKSTCNLSSLDESKALKCHQCTSYNMTQCKDPFTQTNPNDPTDDTARPITVEFLKECPKTDPETGKPYKFCKKIYENGNFLRFFLILEIK